MSADSLRKQSKQGYHGQVILPQPINDPSLIESVAGFIHEVVPQAYSSVLPGDSKDGILWARFDSIDYNDPDNFPQFSECESDTTPPLLLVLGYSSGVQVWSVCGSGEATELLSWCQGVVKALRFLLKPNSRDPHSAKRPLVAIVDSSSPGPQFSTLSFVSLKTAEVVKIIKFHWPICDVHCNRKSIVVTFSERIAVFDSATLEDRLTITTCYPSPGNSPNPIALGTRWLAYGEKRLTTWQRSSGGCEGDGAQSYTSAVIHAAKSLGKGLRELGGSLTGTAQGSHNAQAQPGIVSIIDIERKSSTNEEDRGNMIAHFVAHTSAVVAMAFDPSGLLLVTADRHGHRFNVFRIHPHPCTSQLAAVHHLYILHRGETTAKVQDIAISWDSRWVAVSSVRGTTHVFPITPYGGLVTVRTHTTAHVVNKLSRFERSAGLRDGRGSPLPCEAPTTPPPPRLPPYPHPSLITPLAQLRARPDDAPLAAFFGPPRAWLPGRPKVKRTCADSLYIIYSSGAFMQYDLDPKVIQGVPKEKISFDTPIELGVDAKAEWILPKPPYTSSLCPPLPLGHVLLDLPPRSHPQPDKWLSQVEIVTHTGPHRRLWMGPQFTFKSIDPLPSSGGEGESGPEGGNPLRSNPVNMPHRPYLLVEIGSGSPQMAEGDEAGGRLREDLADAMLETHNSSGQAMGKLRKAELEWQVNPLGAVQTHPAAPHLHWPHPIFFERYSPELYRGLPSPQKSLDEITESSKHPDGSSAISLQELEVEVEYSNTSFEERRPDSKVDSEISQFLDNSSVLDVHSFDPIGQVHKNTSPHLMEPYKKEESSLPSVSHLGEMEVSCIIPDVQTSCLPPKKEIVAPEIPPSKKPETEERISKPSSKKSRKRRNGSDKKGKKDLLKQSSEESSLISPLIEPETVKEILLTERINPDTSDDLPEEVDLTQSDNIALSVGSVPPILACGVVEVTEASSLAHQAFEEELGSIVEMPDKESEKTISGEPFILDSTLLESVADELTTRDVDEIRNEPVLDVINPPTPSPDQSIVVTSEIESNADKNYYSPAESSNPPEESILDPSICINEKDLNGNNTSIEPPGIDSPEVLSLSVPTNLIDFGSSENTSDVNDSSTIPESLIDVAMDTSDVTENVIVNLESDSNVRSNDNPLVITENENLISADDKPALDVVLYVDTSKGAEEDVINLESDMISLICESSVVETPPVCTPPEEPERDQESNDFIAIPSKSSRNKNRRRKKDKKQPEASSNLEVSEKESSQSVIVTTEEELLLETNSVPDSKIDNNEVKIELFEITDDPSIAPLVTQEEAKVEIQIPCIDTSASTSIPTDTNSDQVASTDKSEIEDVSSHSGKESDDSKTNKKERSRKQKRSESSDKDRSSIKNKSCSPSSNIAEKKESDSSDEADKKLENKQSTPKIPKRKKGKKNEELISEITIAKPLIENSPVSTDIEGQSFIVSKLGKDSSSNSSGSNNESKNIKPKFARSWSQSASSSDHQCGIEDRDSVYESCNDDGASDSLAFESSKEDFDDLSSKVNVSTEPSSSNAEEKTEVCDKINQPLKKVRKQKKKKR